MDQEFAQRLFSEGAALVMFNVPPNTEVGIDLKSWNVGLNFKGIKMIPPGLHFVYYSAVSKQGQTAPRTGFFHNFQPKEVLVRVYQANTEDFRPETPEQAERVALGLKDLDKHLGAYPVELWRRWVALTQHIHQEHLQQVLPLSGLVTSAPVLLPVDDSTATVNSDARRKRRKSSHQHEHEVHEHEQCREHEQQGHEHEHDQLGHEQENECHENEHHDNRNEHENKCHEHNQTEREQDKHGIHDDKHIVNKHTIDMITEEVMDVDSVSACFSNTKEFSERNVKEKCSLYKDGMDEDCKRLGKKCTENLSSNLSCITTEKCKRNNEECPSNCKLHSVEHTVQESDSEVNYCQTQHNNPSNIQKITSEQLSSSDLNPVPNPPSNLSPLQDPDPNTPSEANLPAMAPAPGTEFRWVSLPHRGALQGATPAQVTAAGMDSSHLLQALLESYHGADGVVSELQVVFVVFLVGQSWAGWERWKQLLHVLCRSERALLQHPEMFSKIMADLHYQIQEVPEDLFVDIVENNNFLAASLAVLFANVKDNRRSLPNALVKRANNFRAHLRTRFGWSLELEEDGEDAPVVVELDEATLLEHT